MIDTLYRISRITSMLTIPLTILVCIIFVLRIAGKGKDKNHLFNSLNRRLRRIHIPLGLLLIAVSTIHGICTETPLFSFNWGTICLAVLFLLALSYYLRKHLHNWMRWHRILTVLFLIAFIIHLVEVDGHEARRRGELNNLNIYSEQRLALHDS